MHCEELKDQIVIAKGTIQAYQSESLWVLQLLLNFLISLKNFFDNKCMLYFALH